MDVPRFGKRGMADVARLKGAHTRNRQNLEIAGTLKGKDYILQQGSRKTSTREGN